MSQSEKSISNEVERRRSPSFPVVPIDEAIERARLVYAQDRRAFTDFETLAGHMGYAVKKKGGRSARMVATLKQYGLLDERGTQFRISETAWKILEMPEDSPDRAELIKQAALRPTMVRKILKQFEGNLPSDATLRSHLLFQEKFNADSARDFIRVLRRTVEIVNPVPEDYNAGEELEGAEKPATGVTPMQQPPPKPPLGTPPPAVQKAFLSGHAAAHAVLNQGEPGAFTAPFVPDESVLVFKISRDSEARVIFNGQVTQEAISKLTALLNLSKDAYPTKAELEQPRSAMWRNKDHDQPVKITGELGEKDGKRFYAVEGSSSGIPEDELTFDEGAA